MKNEHLSLDYPHSLASYFLHCYTVIQIHIMLAKFEIKTQNFGIMVTMTTHKRNTTVCSTLYQVKIMGTQLQNFHKRKAVNLQTVPLLKHSFS